jgi:hypothetical protein
MASSSSPSLAATDCFGVDNTVGPWAGNCRGGFDFTLHFEESFMTILPLGVVLLLLPSRVWYLLKRNKKVAIGGILPTLKTVSLRLRRSRSCLLVAEFSRQSLSGMSFESGSPV